MRCLDTVLDKLNTDALAHGRVRLLGLNTAIKLGQCNTINWQKKGMRRYDQLTLSPKQCPWPWRHLRKDWQCTWCSNEPCCIPCLPSAECERGKRACAQLEVHVACPSTNQNQRSKHNVIKSRSRKPDWARFEAAIVGRLTVKRSSNGHTCLLSGRHEYLIIHSNFKKLTLNPLTHINPPALAQQSDGTASFPPLPTAAAAAALSVVIYIALPISSSPLFV